jgi:hypothetical protein
MSPLVPVASVCRITVAAYQWSEEPVLAMLDRVRAATHVAICRFEDYLCDRTYCMTPLRRAFVYLDEWNLSVDGSPKLRVKTQPTRFVEADAH